jgi:hypothetical protein
MLSFIFHKVVGIISRGFGSYCQSGMVFYYLWKFSGFTYFSILPCLLRTSGIALEGSSREYRTGQGHLNQ